jgi:hypothetical protein
MQNSDVSGKPGNISKFVPLAVIQSPPFDQVTGPAPVAYPKSSINTLIGILSYEFPSCPKTPSNDFNNLDSTFSGHH